MEIACFYAASGITGGLLGVATRRAMDGNFDNVLAGMYGGAISGMLGGTIGSLSGSYIAEIFCGVGNFYHFLISLHSAGVGTCIGAFIGATRCAETPLARRRIVIHV
ncbi:MAG: hypothetical protein LBS87_01715 [Puniceicoccales bacterium]|jgi:hypothetical protein|nr:hypothetical protein [Puniceicoccales bacterium]